MKYCKKEIYDAKKDPLFSKPVIDCREQRSRLVDNNGLQTEAGYLYLHGKFEGTNVKFMFCFPEKKRYEWRFFQHLSPFPGPDEELAALEKTGEDDFISFALTHGGAYVESNMGSGAVFGSENDPTIFYRSSAAVAEYCRQVARELFGEHRIYGYVFGGSGGGYKTMSCIENTNAFDGAVPFVIGSPMSLPNCLTVFAYAGRLLRRVCTQISDALEPGGSGDIYQGLNEEETTALRELVQMGFPPRLCGMLAEEDDGALPVLTPTVKMMDPSYFTDFWTKPGYLGAEPDSDAVRDRIHMHTRIVEAGMREERRQEKLSGTGIDDRNGTDDAWQKMMSDGSGAYILVENVPEGENLYLRGVDILFESGKAAGKKLRLGRLEGHRLIPGMSYGCDNISDIIDLIAPGDEIFLDNSDYIAIQTFHRHQVPQDLSFHAWDQFRDQDGNPVCPQRPVVISYPFTAGGCGSVQDGKIQGKVIVMNSLMDGDWPWQADWYRQKVKEIYKDQEEECFRVWYNDNCPHGDATEVGDCLHLVSYLGMLRQALLDVAHWVEQDEAPVMSSGYEMVDNQVVLSDDPAERGGVQPMVRLLADGQVCARVKAGQPVVFRAQIMMPPGAGQLETAEWSFEGEQDFPYKEYTITKRENNRWKGVNEMVIETAHTFRRPGRYYGVVRVISNRNVRDIFTRLRNLDRVCVIVE